MPIKGFNGSSDIIFVASRRRSGGGSELASWYTQVRTHRRLRMENNYSITDLAGGKRSHNPQSQASSFSILFPTTREASGNPFGQEGQACRWSTGYSGGSNGNSTGQGGVWWLRWDDGAEPLDLEVVGREPGCPQQGWRGGGQASSDRKRVPWVAGRGGGERGRTARPVWPPQDVKGQLSAGSLINGSKSGECQKSFEPAEKEKKKATLVCPPCFVCFFCNILTSKT